MSKRKLYYVTAEVLKADGYQTWKIEAASKEEAILEVCKGGGDFFTEEIEVKGLGLFEVTDECEIPPCETNSISE